MTRLAAQGTKEHAVSPTYEGLDHLGIVVSDLERATMTYRDTLGLPAGAREVIAARGLAVQFVDAGGTRLELIAPTRPDSEVSGYLEKRGEGLHHLCLRVADIDAALRELKIRGARLIDEVARAGAEGTRVAFIHPKGAHGVLIELVEHPSTREHP
jgi:methylmalonyl-CoA/ethylmalonyl-CoA epimerase